jgi:hypothetical protein
MLTSEDCRPWDTFGQWLKILEPEFLFLAACEASRSEAVRDVFDSADSLRRIYASPVPLYKIHTAPIGVLLYMLLATGRSTLSNRRRSASFTTSCLVGNCTAGGKTRPALAKN